MGSGNESNGPILRGFQSPVSDMFLYGAAPEGRGHPRQRRGLREAALSLAAGRNHALLHHRKVRGQCACAQLHRQLLGRFYREIAAHLPGAAEDRLADHRRRQDHVVEHDGERPPYVLGRIPGEAPVLLKRKVMTGSLVR